MLCWQNTGVDPEDHTLFLEHATLIFVEPLRRLPKLAPSIHSVFESVTQPSESTARAYDITLRGGAVGADCLNRATRFWACGASVPSRVVFWGGLRGRPKLRCMFGISTRTPEVTLCFRGLGDTFNATLRFGPLFQTVTIVPFSTSKLHQPTIVDTPPYLRCKH